MTINPVIFLSAVPLVFFIYLASGRKERKNFFYAFFCGRDKEQAAALFGIKYIYVAYAYCSSLVFLILALAWPSPDGEKGLQHSGYAPFARDIIFVFDISRSMLSDDGDGKSRLEKGVKAATSMVSSLENDRAGIVVFKGDGYNLVPLTPGLKAVSNVFAALNPEMFSSSGTDIGKGLTVMAESFPDHENTKKTAYLFTDGEEPEGGCFDSCRKFIEAAMIEKDISLFIVPPDKKEGSIIPFSDIVSTPDMKMMEKLARLPGAKIISFSEIHDTIRGAAPEAQAAGKLSFKWFSYPGLFTLAGVLLFFTAMILRGSKWQGVI